MSLTQFYYLIGGMFIFIVLFYFETINPIKRKKAKERFFSYKTNLTLTVFNQIIQATLTVGGVYWIWDRYTWGLLKTIPVIRDHEIVSFILALFLYDLSAYFWHRLNHRLNFLWQFHRCHHSDQDLNTSTGLRFHIGELLLSVFYKSGVVVFLGIRVEWVILFEYLSIYLVIFHHSDLKFKMEKVLSYFWVMPSHHATHHSPTREHHDSNYGVWFSFWDRLFLTYDSYQPDCFGLENESKKDFITLLRFGLTPKHGLVLILIGWLIVVMVDIVMVDSKQEVSIWFKVISLFFE